MTKSASQIRREFLDFFEEKEHTIVASGSLVPADDPTLLFTNAGMNQFKDVFLGTGSRPYVRVADTQKCLRVSGKHNDLEEVGIDTYHHTLFEMLGNWSFGDYFKKEAIQYAWELLVGRWGLAPDRLYATVHEGDEALGLGADDEAANLWKSETSLDPDHVLYCSTKDNFWMMGETGPAGPCSEVHIDLRTDDERKRKPGKELVNADDPRVMEIWNLVFIQYNALGDRGLEPLAAKHVDTGMGLERVVAVLQGKDSTYDTDLFEGLLQAVADLTPIDHVKGYDDIRSDDEEEVERIRVAMRVIADHIRAIAFAVADGAAPSNEGRGYVIRRILRRAVRYGYQTLGLRKPFLYRLLEPLQVKMGDVFQELYEQEALIRKVVRSEEEAFLRTLDAGIRFFDTLAPLVSRLADADEVEVNAVRNELGDHAQARDLLRKAYGLGKVEDLVERFIEVGRRQTLPGEVVFLLHDTYGFPVDLTQLMAREQGLNVDKDRYDVLMKEQKDRARAASDFSITEAAESGDWQILTSPDSTFVGHDTLAVDDARIAAVRSPENDRGEQVQLILDHTPFYGESGGQIGDTGTITVGDEKIVVLDTKKENGTHIHIVDRLPEHLDAPVEARVDAERRREICKHHTATHLMHAALRERLGTHVGQKGSLVAPDHLRFDFSHYGKMTEEELRDCEQRINEMIQRNIEADVEKDVPIEEAKARGAMMFFGEKYGDRVRVVTFDPDYSVELCGGTHVGASGEIGLFQFVSEGSISSGVRRVEAVVGNAGVDFLTKERAALEGVRSQFRTLNRPVEEEVADLLSQSKRLEKELERVRLLALSGQLDTFVSDAVEIDGLRVAVGKVSGVDAGVLRDLGEQMRTKLGDSAVGVLGSPDMEQGKVYLVASVSENVVSGRGLRAGDLVGRLARQLDGGGGGRPTLATAGGKKPEALDDVLGEVGKVVQELLS